MDIMDYALLDVKKELLSFSSDSLLTDSHP